MNDGNKKIGTNLILGQLLSKACLGGAEILVVHLANCHSRNGGESHVVVLGEPGPISKRFDPAVQIHYGNFHRASIRNPLRFINSLFVGVRLMSRLIKENNIQVLQTHLPDTNVWGLVLQLLGKCKVVITIHSNGFLSDKGGTALGRFVNRKAYRMMVKKCEPVVTVSHRVKESFLEHLEIPDNEQHRIIAIENGIPLPSRISGIKRNEIRGQYGIKNDECWVIAAGRFAEPKNFQCLIRAAAVVKKHNGKMKFLIGGDGPLRYELEALAKDLGVLDLVSMPGNLDNLPEIMQSGDVFAIPSLWEGLPLALLEAMASWLPIVGSRARGIEDIIEENKQGILTEINDFEKLAESMMILLNDSSLRMQMGETARELVEKQYDINRVYSDYSFVYDKKID